MKKLSEVAELVGLLRQRIQEYEKAGIALKPKVKDKHGYWLYGEAEIERLWQIKFYLTLGLTVPKIKTIFSNPTYNKHDAIAAQIIELEEQKKKLESMIEVARAYSEMDVLPSDLYRQSRSVLESAPYEAIVPLIGKFISLLFAEADDEFWDDLCDNFSSEQDEEKWAEAVGAIISYYQKGISYKEDSVQRQAGIVYNVTAKSIPDSFIKQLWRCQKTLEDAVDSNDKSIKEALLREYLQDLFPEKYQNILLIPNEKAHVQDDYQKIFVCNGGSLSYDIRSFASDECQLSAEQVSAIAEGISAHHKEQRALCPVKCDEIIRDYANLMAQIEEIAVNEKVTEPVQADMEESPVRTENVENSDAKMPVKEETQPKKRWYESVDWANVAAQTVIAAVAAVAFAQRRNLKILLKGRYL